MPLPDAEVIAVQWAKSNMADVVNVDAIATRLPKTPIFPFIKVFRISGGTKDRYMPIDNAMLQWEIYGRRKEGGPDYAGASLVARTLAERTDAFTGSVIAAGGFVYGFVLLDGPSREDDLETEWARYRVDTQLVGRSIT